MNAINDFNPDDVLNFWFNELDSKQWWIKSAELDEKIKSRFGILHKAATSSELFGWRSTANGRLAEIILLDQFSRNIYRDHPNAFAFDSLALALAQTAVEEKADQSLELGKRSFLYMPYMHSESPAIHEIAVVLFSRPGLEHNLAFELQHKRIIDLFGRYPHRNAILGRVSTLAEIEFLKTEGSSF